MHRRKFLYSTFITSMLYPLLQACKGGKKKIAGSIVGASANIGHLLRDKDFSSPAVIESIDAVIVGGGVSGLSAARALFNKGIRDFRVLDLEKEMGGNAACGSNAISAFPWGAHYVPLPNNDLSEYLDFLKECNVITGTNADGLPIYNELFLCFDPQERLYINGKWQDGLIPQFGVPEKEQEQIKKFLQLVEEYRYKKGSDGKDAFAIPVDRSSKDAEFTNLDTLTMQQWLQQQGLNSAYVYWYVNYSTRDDFGTTADKISAWTGLHYFAARKGKGANAEHQDVLTWQQGNGWLVNQLKSKLTDHLTNNALVVQVALQDDHVLVTYLDVQTQQLKAYKARQCIMAVPQFVAGRLLKDEARINAAAAVLL